MNTKRQKTRTTTKKENTQSTSRKRRKRTPEERRKHQIGLLIQGMKPIQAMLLIRMVLTQMRPIRLF